MVTLLLSLAHTDRGLAFGIDSAGVNAIWLDEYIWGWEEFYGVRRTDDNCRR